MRSSYGIRGSKIWSVPVPILVQWVRCKPDCKPNYLPPCRSFPINCVIHVRSVAGYLEASEALHSIAIQLIGLLTLPLTLMNPPKTKGKDIRIAHIHF